MTDRIIPDPSPWEPACAERHMGIWLYEPSRFRSLAAAAIAGTLPHYPFRGAVASSNGAFWSTPEPQSARPKTVTDGDDGPVLYRVTPEGVAVVRILGTMMKADSKFGGTSTIRTRRALREARADSSVKSILLAIDSGGGSAAGTDALADEVAATKATKPVVAFIEDLGASAAYWVASQASSIVANRIALVGSIGTLLVIDDASGAYEKAGIRMLVITSDGAEAFKGAGVEGTPITDEQVGEFRKIANGVQARFNADIGAGRKMDPDRVKALATGQVWMADEAHRLGLVDAVGTFDTASAVALMMAEQSPQPAPARPGRRMAAEARLRLKA